MVPGGTEVSLSFLLVITNGLVHADRAHLDPQLLRHRLLSLCRGGAASVPWPSAPCPPVAGLCGVVRMHEAVELAGLTVSLIG